MQQELKISLYDLKDILVNLIGTSHRIDVQMTDDKRLEACEVNSFDDKSLIIVLRQGPGSNPISIGSIKCIEFEGFYKYKGLSSKIFSVE